jgi:tetratricopeptide (TPR) repeat protein
MIGNRLRLLAAAGLLAACGGSAPTPPPAPAPAPPVAGGGTGAPPLPAPPAPAPAPVAPPVPLSEADAAYDFALTQARRLAVQAYQKEDAALRLEAQDAFESAARIRPADGIALAELGLFASDLGDVDLVTKCLLRLEERAPDSGPLHWLRGTAQLRQGDYAAAVESFRRAAVKEYRPGEARDRLFKAMLAEGSRRLDAGDPAGSLAILREAVEINPDHPLAAQAWLRCAVAHRRLGKPEDAEKTLRETVARFGGFSPAYAELGQLLREAGRPAEALEVFERSVRADAGFADGYVLKAAVLTDLARLDDARATLKEFDARFPATGTSEYAHGVLEVACAAWEIAVPRFQKALALQPNLGAAHLHMARCYRELGRTEDSEKAMARWERFQEAARRAMEAHRRAVEGGGEDEAAPPPGTPR